MPPVKNCYLPAEGFQILAIRDSELIGLRWGWFTGSSLKIFLVFLMYYEGEESLFQNSNPICLSLSQLPLVMSRVGW